MSEGVDDPARKVAHSIKAEAFDFLGKASSVPSLTLDNVVIYNKLYLARMIKFFECNDVSWFV